MHRMTVHEVARMAQVSVSTVSRVLTGSAPVSEESRRRVLEAVKALGYRPNGLARGLRTRRAGIVALMIPDVSNPFFGELAQSVELTANRAGYALLLCNSQNSPAREKQYLELLQSQRVDGLLVVASGGIGPELMQVVGGMGAIVVAVDRRIPGLDAPWVGADPYPGAREAIAHLVALGHRRIGIVRGPAGSASSDERFEAVARALADHGIPVEDRWTWTGEYTLKVGERAGRDLAALPAGSRPTAVVALSEFMAFGLIRSVTRQGLSAPEDLSVVSFDNTRFSELCRPPLTTISQPIAEMGRRATSLLLKLISDAADRRPAPAAPIAGTVVSQRPVPAGPRSVALQTRLVVRESTAPPRADG